MLTTSACLCQQHSRNLGPIFYPSPVRIIPSFSGKLLVPHDISPKGGNERNANEERARAASKRKVTAHSPNLWTWVEAFDTCKRNVPLKFDFPAWQTGQPMQSQSAKVENFLAKFMKLGSLLSASPSTLIFWRYALQLLGPEIHTTLDPPLQYLNQNLLLMLRADFGVCVGGSGHGISALLKEREREREKGNLSEASKDTQTVTDGRASS